MKKRLVSVFLVAVMLLGLIPMLDIMPKAAAKIMTGEELADRALDIAQNYKTLYVWGGLGQPLSETTKWDLINQYQDYNGDKAPDKKTAILAASSDTFAFDCVGMIKSLLWGWNGNLNSYRGGAAYQSNGISDLSANSFFEQYCENISSDFSSIEVGEAVWMNGHIGLYIGNGLAVEATDSWDRCVMVTECNQNNTSYNTRYWTSHGKIKLVDYQKSETRNNSNGLQAETAEFLSRSDGVWLFPLPQERYKGFTDWAACRGNYDCRYHPGNKHGGCVPAHDDPYGYGHNGIDIAAVANTPVYAAAAGTVYCTTTDHAARGRIVVVEHKINNNWSYYSIYQHLNSVKQDLDGKKVKAGDTIAYTGGSAGNGIIGAYHLHFGIVMARSGLGYAMSRDPYNNLSPVESSGWLLEPGFGTGGVLNNPALNSPAGYPKNPEYPAVIPNLSAHAGSVMYTFDPNAVSIGEDMGSGAYLSECTFYPAAANIKITETCSPYTLPCNNNTASKYNATSSKLEDVFYYNGSYVPVTGIWCNTEGHYWYQCTMGDGSIRYIYSEHTDPSQTRIIIPEIVNGSFPSNITGATYLEGKIIGNGAKITKVHAKVFKGTEPYNGNPVIESNDQVDCFDYSLKASKVDLNLPFQNLSAGTYTLVYEVTTLYYTLKSSGLSSLITKTSTITPYYTFNVGSTHSHSYGAWQNYDDNQHKRTCSCGGVEYKNHTWNDGVITTQPTCTKAGVKTYTCSTCKTTKTESVAATGNHTAGSWTTIKAATCTESGTKVQKCTVCGGTLKTETIPATGHSWNSGVITTQPTCTKTGIKTYTCSTCKTTKTESVAATGNHTAGSWTTTKAATCTEKGTKVQKCTVCGGTLKTDTIPATGHSWNSGTVTTPPTATKDGVKTYTCTTCSETKTEPIPATGEPEVDENAPQLTVDTKTVTAGQTFTVELTASNLPLVKSLMIDNFSYDSKLLEFVSAELNLKNALIADWDSTAMIATVAFGDNTDINGVIMTLTFKAKEDVEGECSVSCDIYANQIQTSGNETQVDVSVVAGTVTVMPYSRGDVNGDEFLNSNDAIYLLRYTLSSSRYPINQGGDFNGDGYVNSNDAIYLLRHTLSPSRYPLHE